MISWPSSQILLRIQLQILGQTYFTGVGKNQFSYIQDVKSDV